MNVGENIYIAESSFLNLKKEDCYQYALDKVKPYHYLCAMLAKDSLQRKLIPDKL
jgi:hypothetical protein